METKRSDKVLKYILVFVAAALAVLGQNIELYHGFTLEEKYPWFMTVAEVFAVFALFSVVLYFLSKVSFEKLDALLPNGKLWDRKWMFLYIAIVDTVLLVLVYPGIEGGLDTQYQIKDFLDGTAPLYYYEGDTTITHSLNDHHPVLTSIVYGGATWLATKVGHPQLGSFVLNFLQVLCFSASFVYATDYMTSLNETFRKLTATFYMFYPVFAYFAVTMVKDSFFGFLFLLYYVLFLKIYDGTAGKKELWWFVALCVLLPLTKKTAVYILAVANLVLIVRALRGKRDLHNKLSTVCSVLLPALVMFVLLPSILFPAFHVYPGGKQEVFGALFQQTARLKIDHPEAFTKEDIAVIDDLLKYDELEEAYRYESADNVKRLIRTDTMGEDAIGNYLKVWFSQGLKHPKTYLKATLGICNSAFAPTKQMDIYMANHSYDEFNHSWQNSFKHWLFVFHTRFEALPGINILFTLCVFSFWIPLAAFYWLITRKGWKYMFMLLPIFMTQLTFIVSPMFFVRYALPLLFCAPLILTLHHHHSDVSKGL